MRFSAIFQQAAPQSPVGPEPVRAERQAQDAESAAPAQELPNDLDARVRLVGEWQLLEG
jgi:hypothetical protein